MEGGAVLLCLSCLTVISAWGVVRVSCPTLASMASTRMGPERTDKSKFQGFGMKIGGTGAPGSSSGSVGGLHVPKRAGAKPAAKAGNVCSLFQESMERDSEDSVKKGGPSWGKMTPEARQAERRAQELQAVDPTIFQYDEVFEEAQASAQDTTATQRVRSDVFEQKKRIGLTVRNEETAVRAGHKREAKYIEKVMVATDRRKAEQQIIEDKLLQKDKDRNKDCQVFVTEAFKEELKRRKKFQDELDAQEMRDQLNAAEKQENGLGFASMYRNMLNTGLATARGSETVIERAPAREDLVKSEDEDEKDVKVKKEENDVKMEEADATRFGDGTKADVNQALPVPGASIKEEDSKEEDDDRREG